MDSFDESRTERERVMRTELEELGLELRDDSRLCEMYVEYGFGNPRVIAAVMEEMEWFFRCTGYVRAKRVIRREHEPFDLDSFVLSELAKNRALRWLVRAGDEETLLSAPPSLDARIQEARRVVAAHKSIDA
jgi:hypothetical protein